MAKSKFDHSKWEWEHGKHITGYLDEIDALYNTVAVELINIGLNVTPDGNDPFSFSQSKQAQKRANEALSGFRSNLTSLITSSIVAEWNFANQKSDEWVNSLFPDPKKGYLRKNIGALEGFQRRKMYGHTLSDRVWNYTDQFKSEIEWSLDIGIGDGRSASELSRDVRKYLNEPDRLFRRVRDKYGNLTLSKAAEAYHPGQGVYRSSYKNAVRLTRTVANMAYCEADYNRWQQFDFVVGINIQVSKSHLMWLARDWYPKFKKGRTPMEICDVMQGIYPKDFKFIGWHPQCKCIATPILSNAPWATKKTQQTEWKMYRINSKNG